MKTRQDKGIAVASLLAAVISAAYHGGTTKAAPGGASTPDSEGLTEPQTLARGGPANG